MNKEFSSDVLRKELEKEPTDFLLKILDVTKVVPENMITEIADFRGYILDELEKRNYDYL